MCAIDFDNTTEDRSHTFRSLDSNSMFGSPCTPLCHTIPIKSTPCKTSCHQWWTLQKYVPSFTSACIFKNRAHLIVHLLPCFFTFLANGVVVWQDHMLPQTPVIQTVPVQIVCLTEQRRLLNQHCGVIFIVLCPTRSSGPAAKTGHSVEPSQRVDLWQCDTIIRSQFSCYVMTYMNQKLFTTPKVPHGSETSMCWCNVLAWTAERIYILVPLSYSIWSEVNSRRPLHGTTSVCSHHPLEVYYNHRK